VVVQKGSDLSDVQHFCTVMAPTLHKGHPYSEGLAAVGKKQLPRTRKYPLGMHSSLSTIKCLNN